MNRHKNPIFNIDLGEGVTTHDAAWTPDAQCVLTRPAARFLAKLHRMLDAQRLELLAQREERQKRYDAGTVPDYLPASEATTTEWRVAPIPDDLLERRVEITGPCNSPKMVINMLNRNADGYRADTAMLDFEDSMKPSWDNVVQGVINVTRAVCGDIEFFDVNKNKQYRLNRDDHAKIMVRGRGLHLNESNIQVEGQPVAAGIFDFAMTLFHTVAIDLAKNRTPTYYIPKVEHYLEARWWETLFCEAERALDVPIGTLRATFLIETLPAALQMEEILYEVRAHAAGLNVGRWDKIFSDIKVLRNHSDRVMEDRGSINMSKPWMMNYAQRLIKICHKHGAMAIGGMAAFTPGRDAEQVRLQVERVIQDKQLEAELGHDGCWVSHPYFISPALAQFAKKNQLDVQLDDFPIYPDLLPWTDGDCTLDGLRTNIRVGIAYQKGWNENVGCVSWDGLMEDLATLEISRVQTWQWIKNGVRLKDGGSVTVELVKRIFGEELEKIKKELAENLQEEEYTNQVNRFTKACNDAVELFTQSNFIEFITTRSELAA